MDKQYSVKFFSTLVESIQRLCRDYVEFDQAVEISGYLSVEIDNFKKERYVLSEMLQSTGNVISESYCTKAFKTHSRCCAGKNALRERQSNVTDFGNGRHNSQTNAHRSSQSSSMGLSEYRRTEGDRLSSLSSSSGGRHTMQISSNVGYGAEDSSDGYVTKNVVSLLPPVQESRDPGSASDDITKEIERSEEVRGTKRLSSFSSSTTFKREKIQHLDERSFSTQDNPLGNLSEASYKHFPSDNHASTDITGNLCSQPGPSASTDVTNCSSTEESVSLPMERFIKEEQGELVFVGSSEEESNLYDANDSAFLLDSSQSNLQTANLHRQSAAYTESTSPGDPPKNMPPKRVKSAAEKEKDRFRSQRYRDEHSKDPEYRAKRATQAKADRATKGPAKYSPMTKARKAANLVKWRQSQRSDKGDTDRGDKGDTERGGKGDTERGVKGDTYRASEGDTEREVQDMVEERQKETMEATQSDKEEVMKEREVYGTGKGK